jgi:hypothetical protein
MGFPRGHAGIPLNLISIRVGLGTAGKADAAEVRAYQGEK